MMIPTTAALTVALLAVAGMQPGVLTAPTSTGNWAASAPDRPHSRAVDRAIAGLGAISPSSSATAPRNPQLWAASASDRFRIGSMLAASGEEGSSDEPQVTCPGPDSPRYTTAFNCYMYYMYEMQYKPEESRWLEGELSPIVQDLARWPRLKSGLGRIFALGAVLAEQGFAAIPTDAARQEAMKDALQAVAFITYQSGGALLALKVHYDENHGREGMAPQEWPAPAEVVRQQGEIYAELAAYMEGEGVSDMTRGFFAQVWQTLQDVEAGPAAGA